MTGAERVNLYLKQASSRGSILGLERIKHLLEMLGNPQEKLKIIHVSGTNGKGSFSAILSSILNYAGYCTGYFSSPALTSAADSFQIGGSKVSEEIFTSVMVKVIEKAEEMDSEQESPTEFELLTAAAFLMFFQCKCDLCIIECGLGGDGDSTNVISSPVLSVITNVRKDHCHILGNAVSQIAAHKAGIIKRGCAVLYGGEKNEAFEVIRNRASEMSSKLYVTDFQKLSGESFTLDGTTFSYGDYSGLKMPLLGKYQILNGANVITAVEILREKGFEISRSAVYDGLKSCVWQGRFEVLCREPMVIFDGAHNPDGMAAAVESIKYYFGGKPIVILMGIMADKEYSLYGDMLKSTAEIIFTVTPDNPRALDSKILCEYFRQSGINSEFYHDFSHGASKALEYAEKKKLPLAVLGSLYMYDKFTAILKGNKVK